MASVQTSPKVRALLLLSFCLVCTVVVPTRTLADWATVDGWAIDTHEGGCWLRGEFEKGIVFTIALDGTSRSDMDMDILLFSQKWRSIQAGASYKVGMDFNRGTNWTVDFEGVDFDGSGKGLLNYDDAYSEDSGIFAEDFMRSESLYISFEGKRVANLNLSGSRAAFEEMVKCQRSFINSIDTQDPFAGSDPFR